MDRRMGGGGGGPVVLVPASDEVGAGPAGGSSISAAEVEQECGHRSSVGRTESAHGLMSSCSRTLLNSMLPSLRIQ